jgi:uncharacterized membrane protein YgcG
MLKNYRRWTLLFLLLVLFVAVPVSAQDKRVVWNRFDVDITVNQDGSFDVVEKQEIQFIGGPFHYGFRDIDKKHTEGITEIRVGDVSGAYLQNDSEAPGTFYIEDRGDSIYVKWFFDDTTDETRTFFVSYKVHGGLRYYDGGDQLWWNAVYADRPADVESSVVIVKVPAPAVIENMDTYFTMADMELLDKQTAKFTARDSIPPGMPFEVRVQFTHGVVAGTAPAWQRDAERELAREHWRTIADLFVGFFALMLLVLAPVGLYLLWYLRGRDPQPQVTPTYLPEPPSNLLPGMAGTIIDETADTEDVLATIVDLARRGYLRMEELGDEDDSGYSADDFLYTKLRDPDESLRDYERLLLEKLFNGESERKLSSLKYSFYKHIAAVQEKLYEEVTAAGYFVANPAKIRQRWLAMGFGMLVLLFISACLMLPILNHFTDAGILLYFGPGLFALGLLVLSRFMPRKTQQGADEAAKWKAFRTYLQDIDQYTDLEKATELFERYLPYAIAFGIDKAYLKLWEQVPNVPTPVWYGPYHHPWSNGDVGSGSRPPGHASAAPQTEGGHIPSLSEASSGMSRGLAGMSTGLASMLSTASSTLTSRPQSSSGSSGGWSGGGWSGGGGGSFGGGGGGGGGGGFG